MQGLDLADEVWRSVEELLPQPASHRSATGRRRLEDREVLEGILVVLTTGMTWNTLRRRPGMGSGRTCLRRLREWQEAGAWTAVRDLLIRRLRNGERIAWWRADLAGPSARAVLGRCTRGRNVAGRPRLRLLSL